MSQLPAMVYVLCGLTALACVALLWRAYWRTGVRLLLWAGICFIGLSIENIILFLDMEVVHGADLAFFRNAAALVGLLCLLYGLIWEVRAE
ncbi:MAG TPA: DUF5985 family protein [Burkholderiales bacterium]|nr:DUF5985 family protein [Burkholderiales bacterium]